MWIQKHEDECEEKTDSSALNNQPVSPVNASTDTTRQEAEEDHDDKRRRIGEPESPVSTVAQDEVSTLSPVPFDSETRNDEIAVDVPLPEEPAEMSGENGEGLDHRRSLLHSLARCATSATAQGSKDEPLVSCRKT